MSYMRVRYEEPKVEMGSDAGRITCRAALFARPVRRAQSSDGALTPVSLKRGARVRVHG